MPIEFRKECVHGGTRRVLEACMCVLKVNRVQETTRRAIDLPYIVSKNVL